jgi:hypothetical protein
MRVELANHPHRPRFTGRIGPGAEEGGKGGGCGPEGIDGGGYCNGQCTHYAWTKRRDLIRLGNAVDWLAGVRSRGIPTGARPIPGAIAWWDGRVGGGYGHVAYVESVTPTTVTISEMNYVAPFVVSTRTIALNDSRAPHAYIYGGPAGSGPSGDGSPNAPRDLPANRLAHELAFIRSNHSSGNTEIVAYHGSPAYQTLLHSGLTGYPATNDPANVKALALDVNGDGIDELGFIHFNPASGNTELAVYHGSPHYGTLLHVGPTGYPPIGDPQNVTPLAIDTNGDRIDELAFIRSNHSSGNTEIVTYHGSPAYQTLLHSGLTGYPAVPDPLNITPLAIQAN